MGTPTPEEVSQLLANWSDGDRAALDKLMPVVHEELRRLAHHYMRRERQGHTLQTSALINEAYIRLVDYKRMQWQNRAHFFGVAAQLMRRILVDYARSRHYDKREVGTRKVELDEAVLAPNEQSGEVIALDDAMRDLASIDPRKSQIVELRYFGGLSIEETAEVLGVSPTTVQREWRTARAWLRRAIRKGRSDEA